MACRGMQRSGTPRILLADAVPQTVFNWLQESGCVLVLDLRPAHEFAASHVLGAINISSDHFSLPEGKLSREVEPVEDACIRAISVGAVAAFMYNNSSNSSGGEEEGGGGSSSAGGAGGLNSSGKYFGAPSTTNTNGTTADDMLLSLASSVGDCAVGTAEDGVSEETSEMRVCVEVMQKEFRIRRNRERCVLILPPCSSIATTTLTPATTPRTNHNNSSSSNNNNNNIRTNSSNNMINNNDSSNISSGSDNNNNDSSSSSNSSNTPAAAIIKTDKEVVGEEHHEEQESNRHVTTTTTTTTASGDAASATTSIMIGGGGGDEDGGASAVGGGGTGVVGCTPLVIPRLKIMQQEAGAAAAAAAGGSPRSPSSPSSPSNEIEAMISTVLWLLQHDGRSFSSVQYDAFRSAYPFLCVQGLKIDHLAPRTSLPNEILPGKLYLGSAMHASHEQIRDDLGITCVVNATNDPSFDGRFEGVEYFSVPVQDVESAKIGKYFKPTYAFVSKAFESNKRVLVHCRAGVSRSATLVIYIVMKHLNLPYAAALALVRRHRECIEPNSGFIKQLQQAESEIFPRKQSSSCAVM